MLDSAHLHQNDFPHILTLLEAGRSSIAEVGQVAYEFAALLQYNMPLPDTFVIPVPAVNELFLHNQLQTKLDELFPQVRWYDPQSVVKTSEIIQKEIRRMRFPDMLLNNVMRLYVSILESDFVTVIASPVAETQTDHEYQAKYVRGEANLIESILDVLAQLYHAEHLAQRYREWQNLQTIPAAMIIQKMVPAVSSGKAFAAHPKQTQPHRIIITSSWGQTHGAPLSSNQFDFFEVDPHTNIVTQQELGKKTYQYVIQPDGLGQTSLSEVQQHQLSLNEKELQSIAENIQKIRQQHTLPVMVKWAITHEPAQQKRFYVLDVQPIMETASQASQQTFSLNQTKILLDVGEPFTENTKIPDGVSGVGLFRSETLFAQLKQHPQFLLTHNRWDMMKKGIKNSLESYINVFPQSPIWYRSLNFHSTEFSMLEHGTDYEPAELNPSLGFRGALRILHDFSFFNLELETLAELQAKHTAPINIILPFVRTSNEFAIIKKHIAQKSFTPELAQRIWLECDTPENVWQIEQYTSHKPAGIFINLHQIDCLMRGIDPDSPDIFRQYPPDVHLLQFLLQRIQQHTKGSGVAVHVYFEQPQSDLVRFVDELQFAAVVVKPRDVENICLSFKR